MGILMMLLAGTVVNVDDRFRFELANGWVETKEGRYELRRDGRTDAVIRVLPKGVQAMPLEQCVRVYSEKMAQHGWKRTSRVEADGVIRVSFVRKTDRGVERTDELWAARDNVVYQFQFLWTEGADVDAEREAWFRSIA